jgi:hypothetical protein
MEDPDPKPVLSEAAIDSILGDVNKRLEAMKLFKRKSPMIEIPESNGVVLDAFVIEGFQTAPDPGGSGFWKLQLFMRGAWHEVTSWPALEAGGNYRLFTERLDAARGWA